jgi:ABC-type uncharacterized transport system substrate-binding protein
MRQLACLLMCLAWSVLAPAWAQGQRVWVALSGQDAPYLAAANALRARLPGEDVTIRPWGDFAAESAPAPKVVVALGTEAMEHMAEVAVAWPKTAVVALLVPRANLERLAGAGQGRVSGVYFDQPFPRLAQFLRQAMPERPRIGVLLGPNSYRYQSEIRQALRRAGLDEVIQLVENRDGLPQALREVLGKSDVLLAIPDSTVHNSQTAHHALLASYRQGIPMVGYSASYVKAGAATALVSTPEQIGRQGGDMVANLLAGRELPEPQAPEEFEVMKNANVARSLGLELDTEELARKLAVRRRSP